MVAVFEPVHSMSSPTRLFDDRRRAPSTSFLYVSRLGSSVADLGVPRIALKCRYCNFCTISDRASVVPNRQLHRITPHVHSCTARNDRLVALLYSYAIVGAIMISGHSY